MKTSAASWVIALCIATTAQADQFAQRRESNWHQWRGPLATGAAPQADPPLEWSQEKNIKWKTPIAGEGHATPIVWEDRVFAVAAVETDRRAEEPPEADPQARTTPPDLIYEFKVFCLDRETGEVRWEKTAAEEVPHEGRHSTNTFASASPTTDGRRLYVSFGSRGLFTYDLDGNLIWKRDLGQMHTRRGFGEGTSPVVHGDSLIVNWDHEGQSFLIVLDAATGETRWRVERDERTSWSTPLVAEHEGREQLIVSATNRVRSYDLKTGELIWECGGQTVNTIPSPVLGDGVVYCMSGYRGSLAVAIPLDARGDITDSDAIEWSHERSTPYVPSPLLYRDRLYFTASNRAVITCLDANTGEIVFGPERIPGLTNVYASPVAAKGRIYLTGRDGAVTVIEHGPELKVLATNELGEPTDASPALVDNQIFLRSAHHLYCIEDE